MAAMARFYQLPGDADASAIRAAARRRNASALSAAVVGPERVAGTHREQEHTEWLLSISWLLYLGDLP
jgi:hypothetical protein